MSGVALDVPVATIKHRSFARLFLAVLLGYVGAMITFGLAALPLLFLWALPRPWVQPGPFPIDGAWSLAADVVVAALIVLVIAWWIRRMVEGAVRGHVSLAVVALAVAVTAYVPSLVLPPGAALLWGIVALLVTTWVVRRYAIRTAPLPKMPWSVCVALGLVGFAVLGSYRVYHPLSAGGLWTADFNLTNSNWSDLTILRVKGGSIATAQGRARSLKLPYTLGWRRQVGVDINGRPCVPYDVVITYSVLGLTTTQRFRVTPDAPFNSSFADVPIGAGGDEYQSAR
jgi:hypothetical protein